MTTALRGTRSSRGGAGSRHAAPTPEGLSTRPPPRGKRHWSEEVRVDESEIEVTGAVGEDTII